MQLNKTIPAVGYLLATNVWVSLKPTKSCWMLAWLFLLLLQAHPGLSQFQERTVAKNKGTAIKRGYWQLKTQATTRSTVIQFFGPSSNLLYEEILPEKWVRLTPKNEKQVDRLLEQLLANQLLSSRIATEDLPPTPMVAKNSRKAVPTVQLPDSAVHPYLVHAYVNPTGKLYLIVDNPTRLRYSVKVVDQRDRSLYEEFTNHDQYRRKLDLSALPHDLYQLVVTINNKPSSYTIKRQDNRLAFVARLEAIDNKQVNAEYYKADTRISPAPVPIEL